MILEKRKFINITQDKSVTIGRFVDRLNEATKWVFNNPHSRRVADLDMQKAEHGFLIGEVSYVDGFFGETGEPAELFGGCFQHVYRHTDNDICTFDLTFQKGKLVQKSIIWNYGGVFDNGIKPGDFKKVTDKIFKALIDDEDLLDIVDTITENIFNELEEWQLFAALIFSKGIAYLANYSRIIGMAKELYKVEGVTEFRNIPRNLKYVKMESVPIDKPRIVPQMRGTPGASPGWLWCPNCNGRGKKVTHQKVPYGNETKIITKVDNCPVCNGARAVKCNFERYNGWRVYRCGTDGKFFYKPSRWARGRRINCPWCNTDSFKLS